MCSITIVHSCYRVLSFHLTEVITSYTVPYPFCIPKCSCHPVWNKLSSFRGINCGVVSCNSWNHIVHFVQSSGYIVKWGCLNHTLGVFDFHLNTELGVWVNQHQASETAQLLKHSWKLSGWFRKKSGIFSAPNQAIFFGSSISHPCRGCHSQSVSHALKVTPRR